MINCPKNKKLEDCELEILRNAVDNIEKKAGQKMINNPEINTIISIVEDFIRENSLICYGGTAINNILPYEDQFYDKSIELPDYDFFSKTPLKDAKKLADIYYKKGFTEVEAKSGVHEGTFKVYVNYIPVADITYLVPEIYDNIHKTAIIVDGLFYCPPNFLRMAMYLELSRPDGNVSRWEKVLKRLTLLNKHYPLEVSGCSADDIQRLFEKNSELKDDESKIFKIVKNSLLKQKAIFFGAYANKLFLKTLTKFKNHEIPEVPDFDIISIEPEKTLKILQEDLKVKGFKKTKIIKQKEIGEIIPEHYEFKINDETILFVYKPNACFSYNRIKIGSRYMNIATLDTMLSLYLSFVYSDRPYYDENRILCMSQFLFMVQEKNRLEQKGLLKRFSIDCIGEQPSLANIRAEKSIKYKELKNKKNTKEYDWYFLRHIPAELELIKEIKKKEKKDTKKKKTIKKSKSKSKVKSKTKSNKKTRKKNVKSKSKKKK